MYLHLIFILFFLIIGVHADDNEIRRIGFNTQYNGHPHIGVSFDVLPIDWRPIIWGLNVVPLRIGSFNKRYNSHWMDTYNYGAVGAGMYASVEGENLYARMGITGYVSPFDGISPWGEGSVMLGWKFNPRWAMGIALHYNEDPTTEINDAINHFGNGEAEGLSTGINLLYTPPLDDNKSQIMYHVVAFSPAIMGGAMLAAGLFILLILSPTNGIPIGPTGC